MKGTKIISLLVALVLVISMFATIVAPAAGAITPGAVAVAPTTAGAAAAYTITFTTSAVFGGPLVANDITIVLPAGTTVPAGALAGVTYTAATDVVAATAVTSATATSATRTIVIELPAATTTAAQLITINIPLAVGIRNPTTGYPANTLIATVATNGVGDTAATNIVTYSKIGNLGTVTFAPTPTAAGSAASWSITCTTTTPLLANDTITIVFPSGVTVPTTIAKEYISSGVTAAALTTSTVDAAVSGNTVIVTLPAGIVAGPTQVVISQVAGIKQANNAAAPYVGTVETSKDPGPVASAAFSPTRQVVLGSTVASAGSSVTVTGVGFLPNSSIDLTGAVLGAGTTDANGSFSIAGTANAAGACTATDGSGAGSATASANTLTLIPAASISPASGLTGAVIEVTASGLSASTSYSLGVAGTQVAVISATVGAVNTVPAPDEVTTDTTGKFVCKIVVPSGISAGAKVVNVRITGFGGADVASGTFTVAARTLTASVSSGYKGDTVVFTGSGFEPSAAGSVVTVNIFFTSSAAAVTNNLLTTAASVDATGAFSASCVVPANDNTSTALAAGLGFFTARSYLNGTLTGSTARANFTINPPTITITPTTGLAGSEITVTMNGLGAYATYNSVTIDGLTVINFSQSVVTDANGNLAAKFVWPGLAAGAHTLIVTGTAPVAGFVQEAGAVTITGGLNSIAGKYTKVWTFDGATQAWKLYDTAAPSVSDLSTLVAGQGYWIQATEASTIIYGGNTYPVYVGWTLIGWRG